MLVIDSTQIEQNIKLDVLEQKDNNQVKFVLLMYCLQMCLYLYMNKKLSFLTYHTKNTLKDGIEIIFLRNLCMY